MNPKIKLVLYLILSLATLWFGYKFYVYYIKVTTDEPAVVATTIAQQDKQSKDTVLADAKTDNTAAAEVPTSSATNAVTDSTKPASDGTTITSESTEPPIGSADEDPHAIPKKVRKPTGVMMSYGGAFFGTLILLGILAASDVSRFFANKTEEFLFNDDGKGVARPLYEEAERIWANGDHLDAIRLMREYLKEYPRDQFVAIRIAEIYEKDLNNYLAAALEYEEILTKKLPPERWGWAAIHLANLYSGKLEKPNEAVALLRRIDAEHGETAAAQKARQRLAKYDGTEVAPENTEG